METARRPGTAPPAKNPSFLLPALVCLAVVAALVLARGERLRRLEPSRTPWIDPAEARLTRVPQWVDPRWLDRLRSVLEARAPFAAADRTALAQLGEELGALSFVERVERCEASGEHGLVLELALREPVACIPVRGDFALVDEDGVVLEGRWPLPPRLGRSYLPVIGPLDDPLFDRARAGDWLAEPEHEDALDVALSLAVHLDQDRRAALGRILIDARAARRASIEEPGVRLELEGGRLALFGRNPACGAPGELPARAKWRALGRALDLFESDPSGGDWELVDLRWDRPDLALRNPPALALVEPRSNAERRESRTRPERDGSRRQVR